jgi:hypothetical protein
MLHGFNDVRQTAELLVSEPSSFKVKMVNEKLKRYKSASVNQIWAEMFQAGGNTLHSEVHKC